MHDRNPILSVLALLLPIALLLTAGCILAGDAVRDALFAVLKLVVIR